MKIETHVFEDPQLVAFLSLSIYHFKITPQKTPTGRIAFAVEGAAEELEKALNDLTNNLPVGSRSLLESIKRIRTLMFITKSAGVAR